MIGVPPYGIFRIQYNYTRKIKQVNPFLKKTRPNPPNSDDFYSAAKGIA